MSNTINDGSHRHGERNEVILEIASTLAKVLWDVQDPTYMRRLIERAAKETVFLRGRVRLGDRRKTKLWLNCIDGCMAITVDATINSVWSEKRGAR